MLRRETIYLSMLRSRSWVKIVLWKIRYLILAVIGDESIDVIEEQPSDQTKWTNISSKTRIIEKSLQICSAIETRERQRGESSGCRSRYLFISRGRSSRPTRQTKWRPLEGELKFIFHGILCTQIWQKYPPLCAKKWHFKSPNENTETVF